MIQIKASWFLVFILCFDFGIAVYSIVTTGLFLPHSNDLTLALWGANICLSMYASIFLLKQFETKFDLKLLGTSILAYLVIFGSFLLINNDYGSAYGSSLFLIFSTMAVIRLFGMRVIFYAWKHGAF